MDRFGFIHSLFIFCLLRSWLFSTADVHNFIWLLAKFRRRELKDIESKEFQNRNSLLHLNKEFASIYFVILLQCSDFHLNLPRGTQIYILLQLKIEFTWKVITAKRVVIKPPHLFLCAETKSRYLSQQNKQEICHSRGFCDIIYLMNLFFFPTLIA